MSSYIKYLNNKNVTNFFEKILIPFIYVKKTEKLRKKTSSLQFVYNLGRKRQAKGYF